MTVTQVVNGLGSWQIDLADETPDEITAQLGFFGHVAVLDGRVDVEGTGAGLLSAARYVGVLRHRDRTTGRSLSGAGMVFWLGDEDDKGHVIESPLNLAGQTFVQAVTAIVAACPSVSIGSVQTITGTYAGAPFQYVTPRKALETVCDAFGAEFRVNGNASVDAGTAAFLYNTEAPAAILVRKGAGADIDLTALPGEFAVAESARDLTTRTLLLGSTTTESGGTDLFVTGSVGGSSAAYKDLRGNSVKFTRMISESGTSAAAASVRAQLAHNRFSGVTPSLTLDTGDFDADTTVKVGDNIYVYDPDTGLVDPTQEVFFGGQVWRPTVIRCTGSTWPVQRGQTVAFRTSAGVWIDLTPHVVWEDGGTDLTVGELAKKLTTKDDTIAVRVDVAQSSGPDKTTPNAPTGLTLSTSSALDARGRTISRLAASWTAPTLNTNGSTLVDLSHYVFQYRWSVRVAWQEAPVIDGTGVEVTVAPGLPYEARVAAVDIAGHVSAWTAISSITTALDSIAPPAPADPVVASYLGQLRIEYTGTDNLGNPMPSDTNRIEVHVGTAVGFTATTATRVAHISPEAKGVAFATAPYGSLRYVRLIAVDHDRNPSPSSAVVSGSTVQAADGDIASLSIGKLTSGTVTADIINAGSFYTASFGQRVGFDSTGFKAYSAAEALTINLDGVNNLLVGRFMTGQTGRRIEMGTAGRTGELTFIGADGSRGYVQGYTSTVDTGSREAVRIGIDHTEGVQPLSSASFTKDETSFILGRSISNLFGGYTSDALAGGTRGWSVEYMPDRTDYNLARRTMLFINQIKVQATYEGHLTGDFSVRNRKANGTSVGRLVIDNTQLIVRDDTGNTRLWVDTGATRFYQGNQNTTGLIEFVPGEITASSVESSMLKMTTPNNPANNGMYAGLIKFAINQDGSGAGFQILNFDDGFHFPWFASGFYQVSDQAVKESIQPADTDGTAALRSMPVRSYAMKGEKGGRRRIGLVAQEAHDQIRTVLADGTQAIDLYQYAALEHLTLLQVLDRLDAIEGKMKP